jgi:Sulfotransferase domain
VPRTGRLVPADRLLVWEVPEGWEPLCEFLDVPVPDERLPHANDGATFLDRVIGRAIAPSRLARPAG